MRGFVGRVACCVLLAAAGCGRPSNAEIEKRVVKEVAAASPDWKNVKYETRANDTVSVVLATRTIDGKAYDFSFTGGSGTGGVGVRSPAGVWLCKYRYEGGAEVEATKMEGTDADVTAFRGVCAEYAKAALRAVP